MTSEAGSQALLLVVARDLHQKGRDALKGISLITFIEEHQIPGMPMPDLKIMHTQHAPKQRIANCYQCDDAQFARCLKVRAVFGQSCCSSGGNWPMTSLISPGSQ